MQEKIHWFLGQGDCERFFGLVAKNNGEELNPKFVFEGNSGTTYQYIIDIAKIIGHENIGVLQHDYDDSEIDFVDEIFIQPSRSMSNNRDDNRVWLEADEVSLESDGSIRIWWD